MRIYKFLIVLLTLTALPLLAQLEISIDDGMTVETQGGLYISGVSALTETGTGYLDGTVESSTLSGATDFAGLTLSTGFSGTITRTTGTAFSSSDPKTALRSYEMNNTGTALTADVEAEIITAATNNEENGIEDKFIFTENTGTWTGYTDNGSTANNIKAAGVSIPIGLSNIVVSEGVGVGAAIFLEGPYNTTSSNLNNSINSDIPLASPYSEAPRTAASIPAGAVDWVLVELRSGTAASSSLGYRSAFVDQNGNIIDDTGASGIGLPAVPGNHYLVVKHRNHLSVMSNNTITYEWLSSAP